MSIESITQLFVLLPTAVLLTAILVGILSAMLYPMSLLAGREYDLNNLPAAMGLLIALFYLGCGVEWFIQLWKRL